MSDPSSRSIPGTPFGQRLRAARKMAGLSMEQLAGKLGGMVTKQAIGKYESGRMMPSADVLEKLVEVLRIATWGASQLRLNDSEMEVFRCEASPLFVQTEAMQSPRVRRAGLLARLRHKDAKARPGSAVTAGSTTGHTPAPPSFVNEAPERHWEEFEARTPRHFFGSKSEIGPDEEALASPALRRAGFVRQWQENDSLDMLSFREGERLPVKTASALKYRVADHLQKYLELESILGQAAVFENPVAGLRPKSREEVERAAREVRDRWELGTGPVVNLLGLLEDRGVKVYEARGLEGFQGLSGRFGPVPFVAVGMEYPADKIRFTAAHELGHFLCDVASEAGPEGECHTFGAAFLLPPAALEKAFRPSRRKVTMGDLGEIKAAYGISLQAIMSRAHGLGLISDRQLRSFRETLKAKDWLVEEPVAFPGRERALRFHRLLRYAVAADILDAARAAEMAGVTAEEFLKEIGDIF